MYIPQTKSFLLTVDQPPAFHLGDSVYLIVSDTEKDGPFTVESIQMETKTYTLCLANGHSVNNGQSVPEHMLQKIEKPAAQPES